MPFKYNALLGLGLDNTIPLDGAGKIPSTFLPSYVDDVEEYNNLAAFPATGETGKIYVAIDTGFVYRWSGSVYVQIGITAAAGSTTQVQFNDGGAFGGDSGLTFDKTTDALSAGGFIPTSSTVPANGIYLPAANSVAVATNGVGRLFVDASGNVNIGSAIGYGETLGVRGTFMAQATNVVNRITEAGSVGYWGTVTNHDLAFQTNGTEKLRITAAGLVGIGTTSPGGALNVISSASDTWGSESGGLVINGGFLSSATSTITTYYDDSSIRIGSGVSQKTGLLITGSTSGSGSTIQLRTGNSERARIDSSGRFLVGTSTSVAVAGTAAVQQIIGNATNDRPLGLHWGGANITAPYIQFSKSRNATYGSYTIVSDGDVLGGLLFAGDDGTDYATLGAAIEAYVDGAPGVDDLPCRLVFSTNPGSPATGPTERMRIESTGRPLFYSSGNGIASGVADGAGTSTELFTGIYSRTGTTTGGTASIIIYSNGNVLNTNNSYGSLSDLKLKENIVDANSQWDDLKALQVRNYNFKEGQTHTQIGLVAQEVELVSPGLITESPDRDEEGNDLGTVTKSVNYSVLYMKAVKALQEAMERIETLEARLTAAGIE